MNRLETILRRAAIVLTSISGCYILEGVAVDVWPASLPPLVALCGLAATGLFIVLARSAMREDRSVPHEARPRPLPLHTRDR